MQLVGDDGVLDEEFEGDDFEGCLVGGFEHHRAGGAGLLHLQPPRGADAPAVAGFEAGEAVLRHGRGEVVAEDLGDGKEGFVDQAADGMDAEVFGAVMGSQLQVARGWPRTFLPRDWVCVANALRLLHDVLLRKRAADDLNWRCVSAASILQGIASL